MKVFVILLIFFIAISINESYAEMSYSEFQNFCKETENMNFDLMPVDQRLLAFLCDFLELGLPEKYWDWIGSDLDWKNFAQNVSNEYAQEIPLFVEKGHKDSLIVNTSISGRDSFPPPMSAYISFYYDEDNKTKRFGEKYTVKITGEMIKTKDSRLPPLKLFDIGYHLDEIQCKQNLVLIQKYDGSPACVTESTKTKLIERGWSKIKSNTTDETTTELSSRENQDATELPSYRDIRSSIQIDQNAPILSNNELDRTLDELRHSGLPIVMSAIDYEKGVIAIWTPDVSNEEPFREYLGDIPFVLLFEEAPPRWEHGDPKPLP